MSVPIDEQDVALDRTGSLALPQRLGIMAAAWGGAMSGGSDEPQPDEGGLSIDIDPELIAAAMNAVDRRAKKRKKAGFAPSRLQEETGDPVTVDLEEQTSEPAAHRLAAVPAAPAPDVPPPARDPRAVDIQLLNMRLRDAKDGLRRADAEITTLKEERDALERQIRGLREAVQRLSSDAEAIRIRNRKEREEYERSGEERVLRAFFEVGDNVERGIAHAGQDPQRVGQGLQMIYQQFHGLLRRFGVERIGAERGVLFDPALHEAILHTASETVLPGCILDQVNAGFTLRGRLLRPARVVVVSGSESEK